VRVKPGSIPVQDVDSFDRNKAKFGGGLTYGVNQTVLPTTNPAAVAAGGFGTPLALGSMQSSGLKIPGESNFSSVTPSNDPPSKKRHGFDIVNEFLH